MAEVAGPLVNPAVFSSDDPRGSEYAANQSALEHQYNTTLAGDQETLSDDRTNSQYQRSLIAKQEPLSYKSNEAKANAEGLLESGVNAGRRGNLQADFISKGSAINQKMTQDEARRIAANNIAKEAEQSGTNKNLAAYANDKLKWEAEHPAPPAPEPVAATPTSAQTVPTVISSHPQAITGSPQPSSGGEQRYLNKASGKMETAKQMKEYRK